MDHNIFAQLSLIIAIATVASLIMRVLRQPLIVGYILTGVLVGPAFLHLAGDPTTFGTFSSIGIALLLFIVGLGLNATVIRSLGKVVLVSAVSTVLLTGCAGYVVALAIGFSNIEAMFIATALTVSSTIIIVKLLNDKREQTRLYAQITIGITLLEDIVASIALVVLSASHNSHAIGAGEIGLLLLKGAALIAIITIISTQLLPRLSRLIAGSQEFLFLFALAWGLGIATIFEMSGFTLEVGALFAGVSLAALPYSQEIASRLKPLRDFFVVVFFIMLGGGLKVDSLSQAILPAIIFSSLVILLKPFLVIISTGAMGYTKRTSFKAAIPLSQISEFSLIFVLLGQSLGLVSAEISSLVTLVAIITIAVSTYLIQYDDKIFEQLQQRLQLFERRVVRQEHRLQAGYPLVLFGYQKGGHEFVRTFRELHKRFVVVDYNPEVIESLEHQRINYLYGDATDLELLQEIGIEKSKLIVSTITDFPTNLTLLGHVTQTNPDAVIICHAGSIDEAAELYQHGATYVMMPHFIGSERVSNFIKNQGLSKAKFEHYRQKHLLLLEEQRAKV